MYDFICRLRFSNIFSEFKRRQFRKTEKIQDWLVLVEASQRENRLKKQQT